MNNILWVALLSMTPIGELRAGIPFALASGMNPWLAYFVCVVANSIVVPILFFFLEWVHNHFLHLPGYRTAFDKFMESTRKKTSKLINKYGVFGLTLFVAVPLPVTGAYTATLAAWFFGMNKLKTFISIFIGVLGSQPTWT